MKKYENLIQEYMQRNMKKSSILYAIDAVKYGTKRKFIFENLTGNYRNEDFLNSNELLNDLYKLNGGEFKKENRNGYIYSSFFLLIGFSIVFYFIYVLLFGGVLIKPILLSIIAVVFLFTGLSILFKTLRGKFRNEMVEDNF